MLAIKSESKDIYYNLAAEEFLLKQKDDELFMLWKSDPCVVVGKHQNAMAEINYRHLLAQKIPVARRLSGGGTVYHGPGNINFTFIRNGEKGKLVDFRFFVTPVVNYLRGLGIGAKIGKRNDLLIGELKISGNAEHVFKRRVLHHGTLLYNANLDALNEAIRISKRRFIDKAVQSKRSKVTNIYDHLFDKLSCGEFEEGLFRYLSETFPDVVNYRFSAEEKEAIQSLIRDKYATSEWIFGYSPEFEMRNRIVLANHPSEIHCRVKNGIITDISIYPSEKEFRQNLLNCLIGKRFDYNSVHAELDAANTFSTHVKHALLKALFG